MDNAWYFSWIGWHDDDDASKAERLPRVRKLRIEYKLELAKSRREALRVRQLQKVAGIEDSSFRICLTSVASFRAVEYTKYKRSTKTAWAKGLLSPSPSLNDTYTKLGSVHACHCRAVAPSNTFIASYIQNSASYRRLLKTPC